MYVPATFEQTDRQTLLEFIRANSFGLLISQLDGQAFASHLPLLVEPDAGPTGELWGHVARANPQWRELAGQRVLAVFSGPHAYVSPTWYETDNVVPTWNYTAVHVYGRCELVDDPAALGQILEELTATYEKSLPAPWQVGGAQAIVDKLLPAVVGFRVAIERIEGKWKLGQNQAPARRQAAARHLAEQGDPQSQTIARLMLETIDEAPG